MRKNSPLMTRASRLAEPLGLTGHELLHEAIFRLLKPRSRRPNASVEPVLRMTMRSIASSIWRARKRAQDRGEGLIPWCFVAEQLPTLGSSANPHQALIRRDELTRHERILGFLGQGDPEVTRLIDGIGFGLCGTKLAAYVGISERELATARRRLKRRAASCNLTFPCDDA